jgi:hypothetical protein
MKPSLPPPSALAGIAITALALLAPPSSSPDSLEPAYSLGKPPVWKLFTGSFYGLDRSGDRTLSGA